MTRREKMSNKIQGPVLALYDFRAKQKFIYRTNRIKEIIGASQIIKNGFFDHHDDQKEGHPTGRLVDAAKSVGVSIVKSSNEVYSDAMFKEDEHKGIVVYEGGGNLNILFDCADTCERINKVFSKKLLEDYYGLNMICSYVPAELDKQDFYATRKKLYKKHNMVENMDIAVDRCNVLPFVQVDRKTAFPLCERDNSNKSASKDDKVSKESSAKLKEYKKYTDYEEKKNKVNGMDTSGGKELDNYIHKKGEESLLAVAFIDGNNMGAIVADREAKDAEGKRWENAVKNFQSFSKTINDVTVVAGYDKLDEYLTKVSPDGVEVKGGVPVVTNEYNGNKKDLWKYGYRRIVGAGDEATFICNARLAYDLCLAYLKAVANNTNENKFTSCAGIAIFHSHTPFSDAYRIAEECCDNAKKKAHEKENTTWIDYQYCQSGINSSLDMIREKEHFEENSSRPWKVITDQDEEPASITDEVVKKMQKKLNHNEVGRNNVKNLLTHAFNSKASFDKELERIKAHHKLPKDYFDIENLSSDKIQKLIYDMVLVYDIWFDDKREI